MNLGSLLIYIATGRSAGRPPRRRPRRGPPLDWRFRVFVRGHACCACGSVRYVECAQVGAQAVPLCAWCHRAKPAALRHTGQAAFERAHGVRFADVIAQLMEEWKETRWAAR